MSDDKIAVKVAAYFVLKIIHYSMAWTVRQKTGVEVLDLNFHMMYIDFTLTLQ